MFKYVWAIIRLFLDISVSRVLYVYIRQTYQINTYVIISYIYIAFILVYRSMIHSKRILLLVWPVSRLVYAGFVPLLVKALDVFVTFHDFATGGKTGFPGDASRKASSFFSAMFSSRWAEGSDDAKSIKAPRVADFVTWAKDYGGSVPSKVARSGEAVIAHEKEDSQLFVEVSEL